MQPCMLDLSYSKRSEHSADTLHVYLSVFHEMKRKILVKESCRQAEITDIYLHIRGWRALDAAVLDVHAAHIHRG